MLLSNEYLIVPAVPPARPIFIGPAEAKGKVETLIGQPVLERLLEQTLSSKPVKIKTKAFQTVELRQLNLTALHLFIAEVVVTELVWNVRLVVTGKQRLCRTHICPLCKTFPPPFIILGDGVKLRKIKGNHTNRFTGQWGSLQTGYIFDLRWRPLSLLRLSTIDKKVDFS